MKLKQDGSEVLLELGNIAKARLVPDYDNLFSKREEARMSKEILLVVDAVSNEKGVSKDVIFGALEAALASAARKLSEEERDVRVAIDRTTGEYETFRRWEVIEDDAEMEFEDAQIIPGCGPGDRSGDRGRWFHRRADGKRRLRQNCRADRQAGHRSARTRSRTRAGG